jgi:hypothetical protein
LNFSGITPLHRTAGRAVRPIRLATGLANMPSGSSSAAQGGGRTAPRIDRFGCGKDVAQFTKSA